MSAQLCSLRNLQGRIFLESSSLREPWAFLCMWQRNFIVCLCLPVSLPCLCLCPNFSLLTWTPVILDQAPSIISAFTCKDLNKVTCSEVLGRCEFLGDITQPRTVEKRSVKTTPIIRKEDECFRTGLHNSLSHPPPSPFIPFILRVAFKDQKCLGVTHLNHWRLFSQKRSPNIREMYALRRMRGPIKYYESENIMKQCPYWVNGLSL